ncbi:hypothetical protein BC834DRAFT_880431 [Gloeopeniophorella convolvens]|nr:hypothetical protein BC834DRAFT_880431 [Gloeopeniophorella convolvens]
MMSYFEKLHKVQSWHYALPASPELCRHGTATAISVARRRALACHRRHSGSSCWRGHAYHGTAAASIRVRPSLLGPMKSAWRAKYRRGGSMQHSTVCETPQARRRNSGSGGLGRVSILPVSFKEVRPCSDEHGGGAEGRALARRVAAASLREGTRSGGAVGSP